MARQDFFVKELVEELRRIEQFIRQEPLVEKKIYYFSAAYGVTSRTFRYSFSKDVVLADYVLHETYGLLKQRLDFIKSGDHTVLLDEALLTKLCDELANLATKFESGQNILGPLKNIITIGFVASGPGNFLREKGDLEL